MRASLADAYMAEIHRGRNYDRAPGLPLLGFLTGTVISFALWAIIALAALRLFM